MSERYSPLLELVKARLREFYREPAIVFWVFGFPLLMAMGLGAAFRSKPAPAPKVAVVVVDDAAQGKSQQLAEALLKSDRVDAAKLQNKEAMRLLARSRVDLLVTLSERGANYTFDQKKESAPYAQLTTDEVLQRAAGRVDSITTEKSQITEKGSRYIDFLIPGLIGMNLMGSSMWGVGYNLVVARKRKLLRRYAVTPMRRPHFLLSYFLSRSMFLTLELGLLTTFGALVFGTVIQGGLLAFGLIAIFGAASFAGISLMIGARLDNTETANGWMNFVQLPMYVLSGTFFPYEHFPEWLHPVIELLPLTALINALRAIYNDGAGLLNIWPQALVLGIWGGAGFLVALRSFRWQ